MSRASAGVNQLRCLIVDDRPLVRLGLGNLLSGDYLLDEADSARGAISHMRQFGDPDVTIVSVFRLTTAGDGLDALKKLLAERPGLPIVALADRPDSRHARLTHQAGALGFVAKSSPTREIVKALRLALDGSRHTDPASRRSTKGPRPKITRRQREILQLLADGLSTDSAAKRLQLSPETVKTHTKNALARLEARDRAHAVAIALRHSLID